MALFRFKLRGGTAAEWTAANPVLAEREPGVETDTGRFKIGDGSTAWTALPYAVGGDGPAGPANILSIGTVDGGATAEATITGTAPAQTLNLTLPKGDKGSGVAITGSVATYAALPGSLGAGDAGEGYLVTADSLLYVWDGSQFPPNGSGVELTGPKGDQGDPGATGDTGPKGDMGGQGPQGVAGPEGESGYLIYEDPGGYPARPTVPGGVTWVGPVEPTAIVDGDTWINNVDTPLPPPAPAMLTVIHGTNAGAVRPTADAVYWVGSVDPANATDNDLWMDTSA